MATVTLIQFTPEVFVEPPWNCDCDGHNTNRTLAELRTALAWRLGFSAQATNLRRA